MSVSSIAALTLAALVAAVAPRTAAAGPPWISVELPANPHDQGTRGALAVVHLYHHGDAVGYPLHAEAVGLVDGVRRTVRLEARSFGRAGVVAVHGTLPRGDGWVLVLTMQAGPEARASALVALDGRMQVAGVRVPTDSYEGGRVLNPRQATTADVDAMLRVATTARVATGPVTIPDARSAGLALAGLGLGLIPAVAVRRRGGRR